MTNTVSVDTQAQEAFENLKVTMTHTLVLALPNFQEQFTVETDACVDGIGVVLIQKGQPIAYLSKALGDNTYQSMRKNFLL